MLNLHTPFRRAASEDESRISELAGGTGGPQFENAVVADEGGRLTAVLSGQPDGDTWVITALTVAPQRQKELAPRILAVADALAADEGLASVTLEATGLGSGMLAILDQEGFRPAAHEEGRGSAKRLSRPVIPQG